MRFTPIVRAYVFSPSRLLPLTGLYPVLGSTDALCERFRLSLHVAGEKRSHCFGTELFKDITMANITGTVKFFNATKGFGFITPENGGKDHFVHISAVERSGIDGLYENDKVSYEVETGRDGRESAINLQRA